jgi:predicted regulator of Ras-like GTPase activity (Roadblock/LC7/MglB family)
MSDKTYHQAELIENLLQEYVRERDGLQFILLATSDGFLISEAGVELPGSDREASRLATMAVSYSGLAHSLAAESVMGDVVGASIETEKGQMLAKMIFAQELDYVLLACFDKTVNGGIAHWTLQKAYDAILKALSS